jgi:hypothetical protein
MPITTHNLEKELAGTEFQMMLVGPESAGKSLLASTAPGPVLFLDYDLKAAALHGRKGVFALSIAEDYSKPFNQPTAFSEGLDIIAKLEANNCSLRSLGFDIDGQVRTLVFDSIYTLAKAARMYALYTNQKELAYTINIGGKMQVMVPRSWSGWEAEKTQVESILLRAFALKGVNVIAILHETNEEAPGSSEDNPMYTGKISVYPVRYNAILKYFTEKWRVTREMGKSPIITVDPDGKFTKAGNTMGITNVSVPNIQEIIRIARGNGQPSAAPLAHALPTPLPLAQTSSTATK